MEKGHTYDGSKSTNANKSKSTPPPLPGFANLSRFDSYLKRSQGSSGPNQPNNQPHVFHVSNNPQIPQRSNLKLKIKGSASRRKRLGLLMRHAMRNPGSSGCQTMSSSTELNAGIVSKARKTMEQRRFQNEDGDIKEEMPSAPLKQEHKSRTTEGRANSGQHQNSRVFARNDNKFPVTALIKKEISSQIRNTANKAIAHENKICPNFDVADGSDDDDCKAVLILPPRKITRTVTVEQTVTSDIQTQIKIERVEEVEKQEESFNSSSVLLKGGTDKSFSTANEDPVLLSKQNRTNTSCGKGIGATPASNKPSSSSISVDGSRNVKAQTCRQKSMESLMIKDYARPSKKVSGLLPTPIQRPAPGGSGEWRTYAQAKRSDESSKSAFQKGIRDGQDFTKNIQKQNSDDKHQVSGPLPIKAATMMGFLTFAEKCYADMITVTDLNFGFGAGRNAEIFAESNSLGSYRGTSSKWGNMLMPVLPRLKPPLFSHVKQ